MIDFFSRTVGEKSTGIWTSTSKFHSNISFSGQRCRDYLFTWKWNIGISQEARVLARHKNSCSDWLSPPFLLSFHVTGYGCSECMQNEENNGLNSDVQRIINEVRSIISNGVLFTTRLLFRRRSWLPPVWSPVHAKHNHDTHATKPLTSHRHHWCWLMRWLATFKSISNTTHWVLLHKKYPFEICGRPGKKLNKSKM